MWTFLGLIFGALILEHGISKGLEKIAEAINSQGNIKSIQTKNDTKENN